MGRGAYLTFRPWEQLFSKGGGALLRAWVLIQGKMVTKHQKEY